MATTITDLNLQIDITGSGSISKSLDMANWSQSVAIGQGTFLDAIQFSLSFGTGNNNANNWFHDTRTIAGNNTNDDLDLAGVLSNSIDTLTFTKIKALVVAINSPDGNKELLVGPGGVNNGFLSPWNDGNAAERTKTSCVKLNPYGWTVTATTGDILRIRNESNTSITYDVFIVGVAS